MEALKLISNIHNDRFDLKQQQKEIDLVKQLDQLNMKSTPGSAHDPQLEATIGAMETAFRMQTEAPEVFDVRKESAATLNMYGAGSTARGIANVASNFSSQSSVFSLRSCVRLALVTSVA